MDYETARQTDQALALDVFTQSGFEQALGTTRSTGSSDTNAQTERPGVLTNCREDLANTI